MVASRGFQSKRNMNNVHFVSDLESSTPENRDIMVESFRRICKTQIRKTRPHTDGAQWTFPFAQWMATDRACGETVS